MHTFYVWLGGYRSYKRSCSLKYRCSGCGEGQPWDCWAWPCCGSVAAGTSDSMRSRQNGNGVTLSFGRSEQNGKEINHSGSLMKWVSEEMVSVLLSAIICFLKTQAPVTHLRCLNNSRYLLTAVSSAIHLGSLCNSEALIGSSQKQRGRTWEDAAVPVAGAVEPLALSLLGSPAVGAQGSKAAFWREHGHSEPAFLSKSQPPVPRQQPLLTNTCVLGALVVCTVTTLRTKGQSGENGSNTADELTCDCRFLFLGKATNIC